MNELERVEAQALRDVLALGGGRAGMAGGAMCLRHDRAPLGIFNRALPLGAAVDVGSIAAWYGGHPHQVAVPAGYLGLDRQLDAAGYEREGAIAKHQRSTEPALAAESALRVEETTDLAAYAATAAEGYGLPPELAGELCAFVGGPGWQCFVAWDGDEPAGCGALYVDGPDAWLGVDATRPPFRGRGAQAALIAARIGRAKELGALRVVAETDPDGASFRNYRRAGFHQPYVREHWHSPA